MEKKLSNEERTGTNITKSKKGRVSRCIYYVFSSTSELLNMLEAMYTFFLRHKDECIMYPPEIFYQIHGFLAGIYPHVKTTYLAYQCFYASSIAEILDVKKKYGEKIYTKEDIIFLNMLQGHGTKGIISMQDAEYILAKRREMAKNGYCMLPDKTAANILYLNASLKSVLPYQKVMLEEKIARCHYDNLSSNEVSDIYKKDIMEECYPGMYGLCFTEEAFFIQPCHTYLWETEKIEMLENMAGKLNETEHVAVSGRPYVISAYLSVSGISIKCNTYHEYRAQKVHGSVRAGIPVNGKCDSVTIAFFFDKKCYYMNKDKGKLRPATLRDLSRMYVLNDTMQQIIDIYMESLIQDGAFVWKDLKEDLTLQRVLPCIINEMYKCRTKQEMMETCYKNASFYNWNRKDLFYGYIAMKTLPCIREMDKNILIDYVNKLEEEENETIYYHVNEEVKKMIVKIILSRLQFATENNDYYRMAYMARDYIDLAKRVKEKISLRFQSPKKLEDAHNRLAGLVNIKNIQKITIPKHSVFLPLRDKLPAEFEWIKTRKRLAQEAAMMHHCVAIYDKYINNDTSAIYSFIWEGERYTIEFKKKRGRYQIAQMYGKYDKPCPKEAWGYVNGFIS